MMGHLNLEMNGITREENDCIDLNRPYLNSVGRQDGLERESVDEIGNEPRLQVDSTLIACFTRGERPPPSPRSHNVGDLVMKLDSSEIYGINLSTGAKCSDSNPKGKRKKSVRFNGKSTIIFPSTLTMDDNPGPSQGMRMDEAGAKGVVRHQDNRNLEELLGSPENLNLDALTYALSESQKETGAETKAPLSDTKELSPPVLRSEER